MKEECSCWYGYPNKMWHHGEDCKYYECVEYHNQTHQTKCKLKEEYKEQKDDGSKRMS